MIETVDGNKLAYEYDFISPAPPDLDVEENRNGSLGRGYNAMRGKAGHHTMPELHEQSIGCPYCGETIVVLVDDSQPEQEYIEDCQVCCRPIVFDLVLGFDGEVQLSVRTENE